MEINSWTIEKFAKFADTMLTCNSIINVLTNIVLGGGGGGGGRLYF